MKLDEIIKDAGKIVGVSVAKTSSNYSVLFRCANLVVSNIAVNYLDCVDVEKFNVEDGKIDFSQFQKNCFKIRSVKMYNNEIDYDLYMNRLTVPNGEVTVEYAYIPKFTDGEQEIVSVMGKFDESILLYGIVAEYASISGLFTEHKIYSGKFDTLLSKFTRCGHMRVMP
jgi:hypothetical protein